jgi:hypothetical protein
MEEKEIKMKYTKYDDIDPDTIHLTPSILYLPSKYIIPVPSKKSIIQQNCSTQNVVEELLNGNNDLYKYILQYLFDINEYNSYLNANAFQKQFNPVLKSLHSSVKIGEDIWAFYDKIDRENTIIMSFNCKKCGEYLRFGRYNDNIPYCVCNNGIDELKIQLFFKPL